jgi:ADP-ribose pyrophosphatase
MRASEPGPEKDGWKTAARSRQYADAHLEVVSEEVQTPSRPHPKAWTTVHRKSAVVIAAMTREGKFLLVRQERIPIRLAIWEMPAGQIDEEQPGRDEIEATARRELCEETGYELAEDGELLALGDFFASPGFTDERQFLFLARPVVRADGKGPHSEEFITDCRAFSGEELRRMIAEGEIRDANTLSTFARLAARGLLAFGSGSV